MKHLRDRKYYEDLYDRHTVEDALSHENLFLNSSAKHNGKKIPDSAKKQVCSIALYFLTGSRYQERESTIEDWMERDRILNDIYENSPLPAAECFLCSKQMTYFDKMLQYDFDKPRDAYVEFIFKCDDCEVHSLISKHDRKNTIPWQCPNCKRRLDIKRSKVKSKITTIKTCKFCNYQDKDVFKLKYESNKECRPSKAEIEKFREDKARFCLSEEDGQDFLRFMRDMESLKRLTERVENVKQVPKIKVLSVKELKELLKKALKNSKFENISFTLPDSHSDIILQFKAIDSKSRKPFDVRKNLKKEILSLCEGTNWKLMSDGIESRLGIVSGRLRGKEIYEGISTEDVIF